MILGILVTHGSLAAGLKDAVGQMLGEQPGFYTLSNTGVAGAEIIAGINKILQENSGSSAVLFSDLYGGSCWRSCRFVTTQNAKVAWVSGVNLPMLLTFFSNRSQMEFDQLLQKVVKTGQEGIKVEN